LPTAGEATGLDGWQTSDEYGNPLDPTLTGRTATNSDAVSTPNAILNGEGPGYGWLGAKERATDPSGLLLMGARLYNPATGAFTSTDPVFGGNTTAYAYPQDPINTFDVNGTFNWKKAFKNVMKAAATAVEICAYSPGAAGTVCSGIQITQHVAYCQTCYQVVRQDIDQSRRRLRAEGRETR
jgi:RHS repeat-associated protein